MALCGVVAWLIGAGLLIRVAPTVTGLSVGLLVWLVLGVRTFWNMARQYGQWGRFRLYADGTVLMHQGPGQWVEARLRAGSLATAHWAWLRLETAESQQVPALVSRKTADPEAWRRFQVIWWHFQGES